MQRSVVVALLVVCVVACGSATSNEATTQPTAIRSSEQEQSDAPEPLDAVDEESSYPDLASPEGTFNTLVEAIRRRDLDTYRECWSANATRRGEAQIELAESDLERFWSTVSEMFIREWHVEVTSQEASAAQLNITSATPGGQDIGGMSLVLVDDAWQFDNW